MRYFLSKKISRRGFFSTGLVIALVIGSAIGLYYSLMVLKGGAAKRTSAQVCGVTDVAINQPLSGLIDPTQIISWTANACVTDFNLAIDRLFEDRDIPCGATQVEPCLLYYDNTRSHSYQGFTPGSSYLIKVYAYNRSTGQWEGSQAVTVTVAYPPNAPNCQASCVQVAGRTQQQCAYACQGAIFTPTPAAGQYDCFTSIRANPSSVGAGGNFTCSFAVASPPLSGAHLNCAILQNGQVVTGGGAGCVYSHTSGNRTNFSCTAPAVAGNYDLVGYLDPNNTAGETTPASCRVSDVKGLLTVGGSGPTGGDCFNNISVGPGVSQLNGIFDCSYGYDSTKVSQAGLTCSMEVAGQPGVYAPGFSCPLTGIQASNNHVTIPCVGTSAPGTYVMVGHHNSAAPASCISKETRSAPFVVSNAVAPTPTSGPPITTVPPATPTVCSAPAAPQFITPQGSIVTASVSPYSITWTAPVGVTTYNIKINDLGVNNAEVRFNNDCTLPPFPGDVCINAVSATTTPYIFQDGHMYTITIETSGPCGAGNPAVTTVTASGALTSCTIQGYKSVWNNDPAQNAQVAQSNITANNTLGTISYSSGANPYSFSVPGNADYNLTAAVANGYSVSSTLCINKTDCHNQLDPSLLNSTTKALRCPSGGFVDLWWHYQQTSTCAPLSAPNITNIAINPNGVVVPGTNVVRIDYQNTSATAPVSYNIEYSTDNMFSWSNFVSNYKNTSYTTYIADIYSNFCFRVAPIDSCGSSGIVSAPKCLSDFSGTIPTPTIPGQLATPTPTLIPTTALLQCYGTQHCTDGNLTWFEYCGDCTGPGCRPGFACADPTRTCVTYPGKKFVFDTVYPVQCSLLTPTPAAATPILPRVTCSSCDVRNPYLCTTTSGGATFPAGSTFCWSQPAPQSSFVCNQCPGLGGGGLPTPTPLPPGAGNPSNPTVPPNPVLRAQIGNQLERITITWDPIVSGYPKLEISTDGGVTWQTRLDGKAPYPWNYYTTTIVNAVNLPILIRFSVIGANGQSSPTINIAVPPNPPAGGGGGGRGGGGRGGFPSAPAGPVSPLLIAAGGIILALIIAAFMIGI